MPKANHGRACSAPQRSPTTIQKGHACYQLKVVRGSGRMLRWLRRGLALALLTTLIFGLTLLVCELFLQVGPLEIPHSYSSVVYINTPHSGPWAAPNQVAEHRTPCYVTHKITFNAHGMRDKPRKMGVPSTLRIALIGDSYLQGLQVSDEENVSRQLEQHLQSIVPGVEVLNFGVSSTGTSVQLMRYYDTVRSFHPHIVVLLFTVGNDITDNHPTLKATRDPLVARASPYFLLDEAGQLQTSIQLGTASHTSPIKAIVGRSIIARLLIQSINRFRTRSAANGSGPSPRPMDIANDRYLAEAKSITLQVTHRFAKEVTSDGAQFMIGVVPSGIYALSRGAVDLQTRSVEALLRSAVNGEPVPVLSFANALADYAERQQQQPQFAYSCDAHWNALGHEVVATAIAEALTREGWIGGDHVAHQPCREYSSCETSHLSRDFTLSPPQASRLR